MYQFAIVALLALAVVKVVDFIDGAIPAVSGFRSVLTFMLGIASVWALDYSVFDGFGIATRNDDIAMLMTGFIVAGLTSPWRALFGYMTHDRAAGDETLGGTGTCGPPSHSLAADSEQTGRARSGTPSFASAGSAGYRLLAAPSAAAGPAHRRSGRGREARPAAPPVRGSSRGSRLPPRAALTSGRFRLTRASSGTPTAGVGPGGTRRRATDAGGHGLVEELPAARGLVRPSH